jgi:trans-aconitate 2-methyltransferase
VSGSEPKEAMNVGPLDWDAEVYERISDPQFEWGMEVLDRLELAGGETVLDAGCGSGRVTAKLLERLPQGKVIAVDASPSMLEKARESLGDRVTYSQQDLADLRVDEPVDIIFSTATFHWILDHERLFRRLFASLVPGGTIEAQCGGEGNVAEWMRAIESAEGDERFRAYLRGMSAATNFASVGDTEARLERTGFEVRSVWLENKTVQPSEPRAFVATVGLAKHLHHLPADLHEEFIDAILGSMPRPLVLEYVRLNISARRPR